MKIETEQLTDHQVKITAEIETEKLERAKHKAAKKLAERTKIPGFRPGKAPYPVIVRHFGEAAVIEEAMEFLIDDVYPEVISESGIHPYGPGKLEKIVSLDPPVFEFVVPLEAEVTLGDYKAIRVPYEPPEVSDEEVQNLLAELRERQVILEPSTNPVQESDLVIAHLVGKLVEDEKEKITDENDFSFVIRTEDDRDEKEWPYQGFSRVAIGMTVGEEKNTEHTYGDESEYEYLRGKSVTFNILIKDIKTRTLPEIDDELAKSIGDFATLDDLTKEIRTSIQQQKTGEYNEGYDQKVIEELVEQSSFIYAPQMLEDEIDSVVDNYRRRLSNSKLDFDLYLKARSLDMDGFRQEVTPIAEEHLKQTLAIYEVGQAEKIEVDQEELENETSRTMSSLAVRLPKNQTRRLSDENVVRNIMTNVAVEILNHKVIERMRLIASGQEYSAATEEQTELRTEDVVSDSPSNPAETTESDDHTGVDEMEEGV